MKQQCTRERSEIDASAKVFSFN